MARYARLDRSAVESLARRFGIDDITAFSIMDGGMENTSYCVTTSSAKYVLTLWDQKSLAQASQLASLLVYLTARGIRTSRVVVPPTGPIVMVHNDKPVMMKQYVEGDVTSALSDKLLLQLGEEMARLHEIPAPSNIPRLFPYGRSFFHEVIDCKLDHVYIDWLAEKIGYLREHLPAHLPMALIHGDVFFNNVIVQGDRLMAIIDFEEACHYYRGFDLGMMIVGTCRDRNGICFDKAARIIRGYEKETNVPSLERKTLKTFTIYAAVATSFWRFRQYHLRRPEPELHERHVEMQSLADILSDCPDSSFTQLFG